MSPNVALALQIISLIEALEPTAVKLFNDIKGTGMTVDQYLADAKAKDAAEITAAQTEIAADQKTGT